MRLELLCSLDQAANFVVDRDSYGMHVAIERNGIARQFEITKYEAERVKDVMQSIMFGDRYGDEIEFENGTKLTIDERFNDPCMRFEFITINNDSDQVVHMIPDHVYKILNELDEYVDDIA